MESLRLVVVLLMASIGIACILGAYPVVDTVVLRASGNEALAAGSMAATLPLWKFVSWFFYSLLVVLVLTGACLAAGALGVLTWIADKVIRGVSELVLTVRGAWNGTPRDTVMVGGKPIGYVLQTFRDKIIAVESELQAKIACIDSDLERLAGKTSHLPDPPKPKTAEQELEELRAEVARLKAPAPKPVAPAPIQPQKTEVSPSEQV